MLSLGHGQITPKVKQAPNSIVYLYAATCGALRHVDIHFKNSFVILLKKYIIGSREKKNG